MSPAPTNAMETSRPEAKARWRPDINDRRQNTASTIAAPAERRDPFQIQQPQHGGHA
jgi:hypothetical protein